MDVMGIILAVWENLVHITSIFALVVSLVVLCITTKYNKKTIAIATKNLNRSEQSNREISYRNMLEIVNESDKGYDVFPKLCVFFDSYQGIWVDDKIKKFVTNTSEKMKELKKKYLMQEPEPEQLPEEMIEEHARQEQEYIDNLSPYERYDHEFNQKFGNVKEELQKLICENLKNIASKINEK